MKKGKYYNPKAAKPQEQPRRKVRISSILFCIFYIAMIAAFFIAMKPVLTWLEDWLERYEAGQPKYKCQEYFDQVFADPDWEALYELAGVQDTTYEGAKEFAQYMEEKYGSSEITYQETSAGLSGDKKYIVTADGEKFATFTLTGGAESQTDIPVWEPGVVEVFFTRTRDVAVERLPGTTVYINGVALDDSFTVYTVSTVAEDYIPEELSGYRLERQYISGLLVHPQVEVKDAEGNPLELTYDSNANCYRVTVSNQVISDAEKALVVNAAKAYAKRMINIYSKNALKTYFDANSEIYRVICEVPVWWMQSFSSYAFEDEDVSAYYRYSDDLYSARVRFTLSVTRPDGSIKEWPMDNTFFCTTRADGSYIVTNMTNVDTQALREQVRLTFMNGNTQLESVFVDATQQTLTLPAVTAPEGSTFAGWAVQTMDDNGKITMSLKFAPDENNQIHLAAGTVLEPMTLYALFE